MEIINLISDLTSLSWICRFSLQGDHHLLMLACECRHDRQLSIGTFCRMSISVLSNWWKRNYLSWRQLNLQSSSWPNFAEFIHWYAFLFIDLHSSLFLCCGYWKNSADWSPVEQLRNDHITVTCWVSFRELDQFWYSQKAQPGLPAS